MNATDNRTLEILGLDVPNELTSVRQAIQSGFPPEVLPRIVNYLKLKSAMVPKLVGISERTLTRKRHHQTRLDPISSDRIYRLARIVAQAEAVFENRETAQAWLKRPNPALGGGIPLDFLDTDAGTLDVSNLLGRIEHGVLS